MRKFVLLGVLAVLATGLAATTAPASKRLGKIIVNSGESIQCPAGSAACVVSVQATGRDRHNHRLALGRATITIAPAATSRLTFKLNATAKRMLLTRGPLRASLTVTVREGAEAPIVSTHSITIGLPKRHGHRR